MKNLIRLFLLLTIFPAYLFSQSNDVMIEKTTSFYPDQKSINEQDIKWNYLIVPENWDKPEGKKIKIAVVVLKNSSNKKDTCPIVYIEGGPGSGDIKGIQGWINHPLRKNNDIVLIDIRGTGFSLPKFCPDLGKKFLEILAKNQTSKIDEQQKVLAAIACKDDLIKRGIDLNAYNSKSISRDLNALKKALKYENWNVYAVSYGTYVAQVYANDFPEDIKTLILDSSISDISQYYNQNTDNYINSLKKVFEECKNDPACNKQYPDLEKKYYNTIAKLTQNPITVPADKKKIPSGKFTYNAEDFKIAVQQCLYQKKLIEVLPLLITEFDKGNKNTLGAMVTAFSGGLGLDYGLYYCISCNEVIPNNSIVSFDLNASKYKDLKGGLSFYKSDFLVCNQWNLNRNKSNITAYDLSDLSKLNVPVLIFSGEFDPITPASNGTSIVKKFKNAFLVTVRAAGHVPAFSKFGSKTIGAFLNNPKQKPNVSELKANSKIDFVKDIKINSGISNFANALNEFNFLFLAPFLMAVIITLVTFFSFIYLLIKKKNTGINRLMQILILVSAFLAIFIITGFVITIINVADLNFYILAFGIPEKYEFLLLVQLIFILFTFLSVFYFLLKIKSISNATVILTILFSFVLIIVYFQYWGFLIL
ncbi:alpha/beta fold hydrolase [Flavobacterium psychroterrae]|uniref:Proline iminopeptidase n=1 Tax=Flavobacterium psychroterrae TaxID=2133767 RepID=A0ABS5PIR0_9FLAO|nr:alpha/beta fold hydrolase [Flavobacterium psychroterrae]MBS7233710.1 alpha/beta fold hydrolase [Flavobacterium psychroterrae]